MKIFKKIGIALTLGAISIAGLATSAQAQSLDDVLRAAREERQAVARENAAREQEFVAEKNKQASRLSGIRNKVAAASAESDRLDTAYKANVEQLDALQLQLKAAQGQFGELFGAARQGAAETAAVLERSIISAQFPGRVAALKETAESETLPSVDELEGLWFTLLQEMTEQAKVVTFPATVIGADNKPLQGKATRIGPFTAFSGGKYMTFNGAAESLQFLPRQPSGALTGMAKGVEGFSGSGFTKGAIDPTLGTILGLVVDQPTLTETVKQGRAVGYVILGIAALGIVIGLFKILTLWGTGAAVRGQIRKKSAGKGNPLGRVMMAYESNTSADVQTMSLKLDDAVLKEIPRLESGINLVKVLAAVAPLLGLLGTVIGMIRTFQAITLYGAGDPQTMASGISEALVTTVLGLVAAIPLLLIHAFASGASRSVSQVLEEQAAGMIAEHAESRS
ncbi:MAG: MotA/TolQ/ExbB proton channel family protein [Parvularculaceae bacterium]